MTIASSSSVSTVERGFFGPVRWSWTEVRFFHLATVFRVDAVALGQGPQARLTLLYRSTDCRRRCGAPVVNLSHSASLHSREKGAPSNPGIKQLVRFRVTWNQLNFCT